MYIRIINQPIVLMKKFIYASVALFMTLILASCGDDKDDPAIPNLAQIVVGEWVNTAGTSWTTYNFSSNGQLRVATDTEPSGYYGIYLCDGSRISGTYHNGMGFDWDVTLATQYVIKYVVNGSTGTQEINRIIGNKTVNVDESVDMDLAAMTGGINVSSCQIADPSIATYNQATGKITGVMAGTTFARIVSEWGILAVKIEVNSPITPNPSN